MTENMKYARSVLLKAIGFALLAATSAILSTLDWKQGWEYPLFQAFYGVMAFISGIHVGFFALVVTEMEENGELPNGTKR